MTKIELESVSCILILELGIL